MFLQLTYSYGLFQSTILKKRGKRGVCGPASLSASGLLPGSSHRGMQYIITHDSLLIYISIPEFNDLLALVSSLFASWFTYGVSGFLWLFLNWHQWTKNTSKVLLTVANLMLVTIGSTICFLGLYASGYAIHTHQGQGGSWSCFRSSPS
jgi:hypothetical protein